LFFFKDRLIKFKIKSVLVRSSSSSSAYLSYWSPYGYCMHKEKYSVSFNIFLSDARDDACAYGGLFGLGSCWSLWGTMALDAFIVVRIELQHIWFEEFLNYVNVGHLDVFGDCFEVF